MTGNRCIHQPGFLQSEICLPTPHHNTQGSLTYTVLFFFWHKPGLLVVHRSHLAQKHLKLSSILTVRYGKISKLPIFVQSSTYAVLIGKDVRRCIMPAIISFTNQRFLAWVQTALQTFKRSAYCQSQVGKSSIENFSLSTLKCKIDNKTSSLTLPGVASTLVL